MASCSRLSGVVAARCPTRRRSTAARPSSRVRPAPGPPCRRECAVRLPPDSRNTSGWFSMTRLGWTLGVSATSCKRLLYRSRLTATAARRFARRSSWDTISRAIRTLSPWFASVMRMRSRSVLIRDGRAEDVEIFAFGQLHERQPVAPGEDDVFATIFVVRGKAPQHRVP